MVKSNKKRPLTKEEKEIVKAQIERLGNRNQWLEFQSKYYDLMLKEGLEQNYLKTVREYKDAHKEFVNELELNKNIMKELGIQLAEGVEIKDIKTVEQIEDEADRERTYVG